MSPWRRSTVSLGRARLEWGFAHGRRTRRSVAPIGTDQHSGRHRPRSEGRSPGSLGTLSGKDQSSLDERMRTSPPHDWSAPSKVTSFTPATEAKASREASAQTLGERLERRECLRNSFSKPSGSVLSTSAHRFSSAKAAAVAARAGVVRRTPTGGLAARRLALPEMRIAAESRGSPPPVAKLARG